MNSIELEFVKVEEADIKPEKTDWVSDADVNNSSDFICNGDSDETNGQTDNQLPFDDTHVECGKILISDCEENNKFILLCTFCNKNVKTVKTLIKHVKSDHLKPKNNDKNVTTRLVPSAPEISVVPDVEMNDNINIKEDNVFEISECSVELSFEKDRNITEKLNSRTKTVEYLKTHRIIYHNDIKGSNEKVLPDPIFVESTGFSNAMIQSDDSECESGQNHEEANILVFKEHDDSLRCRYCDRRLQCKQKRIEHECLHTGQKLYKCEYCDKRFRVEAQMKQHVLIHKKIKPYKCHICETDFSQSGNLKSHIRLHTGEKPYKCSFCDKQFVTQSIQKHHERTHTGEKPYQCYECGKCFIKSYLLTSHNRRHLKIKPFKCNHCDKAFYTKDLLQDHAVVHSNAKPHVCKICQAAFARQKTLRSHEKIHSDVAEYICSICGKGFKQSPGLYCHMKSHGQKLTKAPLIESTTSKKSSEL